MHVPAVKNALVVDGLVEDDLAEKGTLVVGVHDDQLEKDGLDDLLKVDGL